MTTTKPCYSCGHEVAKNAMRCPSCNAHWPAKKGAHERDLWTCGILFALPFVAFLVLLASC